MCKNYTKISDKLGECLVLKELGINYIVSENRATSPCNTCKKEWINNEPTKDNLTPTMQLVLKANGKIELPTVTEQAVSFGKALLNWAFQGFQNVPENEQKRRLSLCMANTCGMYNKETDRCSACGCICSIKVKFSQEQCPAQLWGPENLGPEVIHNAPRGCGSCGKSS